MQSRSRALLPIVIVAALAEPRAIGPAPPVQLSKTAAAAVIAALQKDRADSEKWLRSDVTSYLATIARRDFGDKKTLTIGRAADNDVRVDAPGIAPHHLRVTVVGDRFHVEGVDRQARFKVKAGENNVATDSDTLDPVADVSIAKSNGVTSQSPGATSSYTITVANAGPSAAAGVTINDPLPAAPHLPFGGLKRSGLGKEGGRAGIEEFLETQLVSAAP